MGGKWRRGGAGGSHHSNQNDLTSCRGHGVIMGTCDSARERETTVEVSRLLNQAVEDLETAGVIAGSKPQDGGGEMSVADLIAAEVKAAKATQHISSVHTNTKGLVMLKISTALGNQGVTPLLLIETIFKRVERTKESLSKYVCRLIPLTRVFFPNEDELQNNIRASVLASFPNIELPEAICRKYMALERERLKEIKQREAAEKKRKRQEAFKAANGEAQAGGDYSGKAANDEEGGGEEEEEKEEKEKEDEDKEPASKIQKTAEVGAEAEEPPLSSSPAASASTEAAPQENNEPARQYTPYPDFSYYFSFTARNHNVLTKEASLRLAAANMPACAKATYQRSQVSATFVLLFALLSLPCLSFFFSFLFTSSRLSRKAGRPSSRGSRPKFTEKHSTPSGAGSRIKAPRPCRSSLYCLDSSFTRGRTLDRDSFIFGLLFHPHPPPSPLPRTVHDAGGNS